ncbi:fluoride efflux transporter FluC [Curtobacterium sp. NPDC087080]|uniref:fluoride efflux transporter FluC n=1 Tax=Curtobacterium sp. NPDC087080 TaxID=3363965 RepID=UPI003817A912
MPAPARPLPRQTLLVGLGGAIGTAIRLLLTTWLPPVHGVPVSVFLINITGAFLLGALLETLTRTGPEAGIRRTVRLFVGTGIIGGYTTYSTLAVGVAEVFTPGSSGMPPHTGSARFSSEPLRPSSASSLPAQPFRPVVCSERLADPRNRDRRRAGSSLRFLLDIAVRGRLGSHFPWGTSVINLTGSFALGIVTGLGTTVLPAVWVIVIGTGLIGGYTTFSTASVETVRLALEHRYRAATAHGLVNLVACVLAALLGLWIGVR